MQNFVTAAVFNYAHEVEILKHRLNMAAINYYFENEATLSVVPMYSLALGGIRLKVHPDDLSTVREILDDLNNTSPLRIV